MTEFIHKNFILENEIAENLYHNFAKQMPIIDFHCHLSPEDIANDRKYKNMTEIWLAGDHYKWRLMRANGIDEKYITGNGSDEDKFVNFAKTVEIAFRNPIFHWVQMELKYIFGISELLTEKTALKIYNKCNLLLQQKEYSTKGILQKWGVEVICTTDDPIDSLEAHKQLKKDKFEIQILPTWRPDKVLKTEDIKIFNSYIDKLEGVANVKIESFKNLIDALNIRQKYFIKNGCISSDHGINTFFATPYTDSEIDTIFVKLRASQNLSKTEILKYKSAILFELSVMNFNNKIAQQFHFGPIRNNNTLMFNKLGPDTGYDSINDGNYGDQMSQFFDKLNSNHKLARSVLYNINPSDNDMIATTIGNYQNSDVVGKMQFGSAWWFSDNKMGMENQLNSLSNHGLLSTFIGMLTDSRSILSYARHDYFRRILCNLLATDIKKGLIPNNIKSIGKMVKNISYYNAKKYFKIK